MVGFQLHPDCTGDHIRHIPAFWDRLSDHEKEQQLDAELALYFSDPDTTLHDRSGNLLSMPRSLESWTTELNPEVGKK